MDILNEQLLREFVDWIEKNYYDPESGVWGKGSEEEQLHSIYDFGNSFQLCMMLVAALEQSGHSAQIVGNESSEFPEGTPGSQIGLDWIVVDNRYVVDPWSYSAVDRNSQVIFDMSKPEDAAKVQQLYPPREKWDAANTRPSPEQLEFYNNIWSNFFLPYDITDKLLGD